MARPKTVSSDQILDAVERVVTKQGAARLSIDAVAREAGISKSRVVLDYKSKTGLLEALIDRELHRESERIASLLDACADTPHPELFARIKLAEHAPDDTERAVALAITSSMVQEESLRERMRDWVNRDLHAMEYGRQPEVASIIYFALLGFSCHEWFGFVQWSETERMTFLNRIRTLFVSHAGGPSPAAQSLPNG